MITRVGLVRSGASVVRTKRSGALLKCALGCALLAHFAREVWNSQAKCALKIGVRRPSAHLKTPQTDFATCALPKCASGAQNRTFAPTCALCFLRWNHTHHFCGAFYRQLSLDSDLTTFVLPIKKYYLFQINLIFPPLAGTESIVLETVVSQRDIFAPFACARPYILTIIRFR